ncbi:MAG: coat protein [[Clostridium] leptum]
MAGTFLGFPFDEELFYDSWGEAPDPVRTAIVDSGAMVSDSVISAQIQNKGNLYTIPFYNVLGGDPVNYDGQTDITSTETDGGSQTGVVFGRAKGFTARNFTAELVGNDPMGHIAKSVARFWNKYRQGVLLKILAAVTGITGASGNAKVWHDTHIADLGSTTATPYTIGETDLNDLATQALGDNKSLFSLAIMHSNVAKTLENKQLLEYWKYTDASGIQRPMNIASANGYTVVVDDGVPVAQVGGSGDNKALKNTRPTSWGRASSARRAPGWTVPTMLTMIRLKTAGRRRFIPVSAKQSTRTDSALRRLPPAGQSPPRTHSLRQPPTGRCNLTLRPFQLLR